MRSLILLCTTLSLLALAGCNETSAPENDGRLELRLSLQPALDLGYNITRVTVTATGNQTTRSHDLLVDGDAATGTLTDLPAGQYSVTVNVHAATPILASGTGTATTSAVKTTTEIDFVDWTDLYPDLPKNVLFIGNSLTRNTHADGNRSLDQHLADLANHVDSNLTVTAGAVAIDGYRLQDHWQDDETRAVAAIRAGNWDLVILQGSGWEAYAHPDSAARYAELLHDEVVATGGQTAVFMTWPAREFPELTDELATAHEFVGLQIGAPVLPVGISWLAATESRPEIELYAEDGGHASDHGAYLICCVLFAAIFQLSPEGTSYVGAPAITRDEREFLQTVAWETVTGYGD
ncbi:MAG: hypothetical protein ABIF77_05000 [bacterium]